MKVSVVIPTFNRADVVDRAIQSVQQQTEKPWEVIVVDDGSTDHTTELIRQKFPTVRLIEQKNSGVSAARNNGIVSATGDWIGFLDSDDEWKRDKLARQLSSLDQYPDVDACHTDEIWFRNHRYVNQKRKHTKPDGWIFENCLPLCCVSPSSIIIKKSVLIDFGMFDESLPVCEDYDLWLRLFSQMPILLVTEPLVVKYGGHDDQLSKKYWGMDRFRVVALLKLLEQSCLSEDQRHNTIKMLLQKITVLIKGFEKRENATELVYYQSLFQKWSGQVC